MNQTKYIITAAIIIVLAFAALFVAHANAASSSTMEKKFEDVKGQLENLVIAKDQNEPNELNLRLQTFDKILDLSLTEVKDLKIKMLSIDQIKDSASSWRSEIIEKLNLASSYFKDAKDKFDEKTNIDLPTIKKMASDFKDWREMNYLPPANQINEYLLIEQEQKALETAAKRWQRIEKDIVRLEKAKIKKISNLKEMLAQANTLIKDAEELNNEARNNFFDLYIGRKEIFGTTTTTSSTIATTSKPIVPVANENATTTTSTSTNATTTGSETTSALSSFQPSIKDLVETSLNKIKEAYQIFIEMSNLVRKLLS